MAASAAAGGHGGGRGRGRDGAGAGASGPARSGGRSGGRGGSGGRHGPGRADDPELGADRRPSRPRRRRSPAARRTPGPGSRCRPCRWRSRAAARRPATVSPTCLSQRVTVPSVTLSPSCGQHDRGAAGARRGRQPPGRAREQARGSGAGRDRRDRLGSRRERSVRVPAQPGRQRRRCAGAVTDDGQLAADRDDVVLVGDDPLEDAGGRGRDLGVDLVGGDLEQRLVGLRRCRPPA